MDDYEYQLQRSEETVDKYGNPVVKYVAWYIFTDGRKHYLGHIFVPIANEKLILMKLYNQAPRVKLNLG